jgi:hypothetical protein
MFIEDKTLQLVLTTFIDLVTNKPIQTKEPRPLPIELEKFQPKKFELVKNHLTHYMTRLGLFCDDMASLHTLITYLC